jgi:hypothetical protein
MERQREGSTWAIGFIAFAACMMVLIGLFHVFAGLAAIINDKFYVVSHDYVFEFDVTAWGWVHLILGAVIIVAAVFLFTGALWARIIGIALAVLSGVANFVSIPYYPVWSIVILAADIAVVWALTVHGRDFVKA